MNDADEVTQAEVKRAELQEVGASEGVSFLLVLQRATTCASPRRQ